MDSFVPNGGARAAVRAGDVIFLPGKQLHSLECTDPQGMRLAGSFCPAGSPAINYGGGSARTRATAGKDGTAMRLWSLHPTYLDSRGLVALWREALLARAVLEGKTRGYRAHPQLRRFRASADPVAAINVYLRTVYEDACGRGYRFDRCKLVFDAMHPTMVVSAGQLAHERAHLMAKLAVRDPARHRVLAAIDTPAPHPLFEIVPGPAADWEAVDRGSFNLPREGAQDARET